MPIFDSLTDKLTIEALDWEHEIPCEALSHQGQSHAADYLVQLLYCNCPAVGMCEERVQFKVSSSTAVWHCDDHGPRVRAVGPFLQLHRVIPINNK